MAHQRGIGLWLATWRTCRGQLVQLEQPVVRKSQNDGRWKRNQKQKASRAGMQQTMAVVRCRPSLIRATLALACRVMEPVEYLIEATRPKREGSDDKVEQGGGFEMPMFRRMLGPAAIRAIRLDQDWGGLPRSSAHRAAWVLFRQVFDPPIDTPTR